jgi:transposase InsO family protein
VVHRNARLTPVGRLILVQRIVDDGWPVAVAAESMGVSRETAYRWLRRYRVEGVAGLEDRSSRPYRSPNQTPLEVEDRICDLRRARRWGPHRIAYALDMPRSTVERVLRRRGLSRLDAIDPPTRRMVRRYERATPGELVHVDVKKLGRIPDGGGWRIHGRDVARGSRVQRGMGYDFFHVAIDDHSRVVYVEALDDEQGDTCAGFITRAITWFDSQQVSVERVMTDNAMNYRRSRSFQQALTDAGIRHLRTRPYRPQTNGKAERFNQTLLNEWAYDQPYPSNQARLESLPAWLHDYNWHRLHTEIGAAPASRLPVNNVCMKDT